MKEPRIYSLDNSLIPEANQEDGFCVDLVLFNEYEALKADRDAQQKRADALAVENGQLREMNSSLCAELQEYESDNDDFGPAPQSVVNCFALLTPNTDAALAAIEVRGVEKAIDLLLNKFSGTGHIGVPVMVLESLAAELREAK